MVQLALPPAHSIQPPPLAIFISGSSAYWLFFPYPWRQRACGWLCMEQAALPFFIFSNKTHLT
jgi:hypothetical protein